VLTLVVLAVAAYSQRVPLLVPLIYAAMSFIAFFAYGLDKSAARTDRWRTQESTLHLFELLGGWPRRLDRSRQLPSQDAQALFPAIFLVDRRR
jgi:hypothetical protein